MQTQTRSLDFNNIPLYQQAGSTERARRAAHARRTKTLDTGGRGHPTTADIDYSEAETEFLMAVEAWKTRTRRRFPTLAEILAIARSIGYTKNVEPVDLEETQEFDTSIIAEAMEREKRRAALPGKATQPLVDQV